MDTLRRAHDQETVVWTNCLGSTRRYHTTLFSHESLLLCFLTKACKVQGKRPPSLFMYKNGSDWFVTQDHNWSPHAMQPFWRCQCNPRHLALDFIPKHLATRGTCSEGTAKRTAIVGKGLQLQRWLSKLCVRHFSNLADAINGTRPQRGEW